MEQSIETRKPYSQPAIVYELELETRAGSTLPGFADPLQPEAGQE